MVSLRISGSAYRVPETTDSLDRDPRSCTVMAAPILSSLSSGSRPDCTTI